METSGTKNHRKILAMARIALFAALTGVLSQIGIPLPGMVPLSLGTLAIYLAIAILDWKEALLSQTVYLLLGAVGVPVFSGFGTLSRLVGPTGGYLFGYVALAALAGGILKFTGRKFYWCVLAMVAGTALLYAFGTAWYVFMAQGTSWGAALMACVVPFLPGDAVKIAVAAAVGPMIRKRTKIN